MNHSSQLAPDFFRSRHSLSDLDSTSVGASDSGYFSSYFALMGKCRDNALRELLPNAEHYLEQGFGLITEYARIDFAKERSLTDPVVIRMECHGLSRTRMVLWFEFARESDGTVLGTGRNAILWVNPQRHPAIMPAELYHNAARRAGLTGARIESTRRTTATPWVADQTMCG